MSEHFCSICGIQESFVGQKVRIIKVNGKYYCEEHAPNDEDPDTETKILTSATDFLEHIDDLLEEQNKTLRTIKSSMTFFVIIVIIGIFVQLITSCIP